MESLPISPRKSRAEIQSNRAAADTCRLCQNEHARRDMINLPGLFSQLRICNSCAQGVKSGCASCSKSFLTEREVNWKSGLCDECYGRLPQCKSCAKRLRVNELHYKTGLCDTCWKSRSKKCMKCEKNLTLGQIGWCTDLCDECYDAGGEACRLCQEEGRTRKIKVDELGWRTGICNECFDKRGGCTAKIKSRGKRMRLCDGCYKHCSKVCMRCQEVIPDAELRWSSGLCDMCFDHCTRNKCNDCKNRIPMKQLRWHSGLCDSCYHKRAQACRMCHTIIGNSDKYHGVRLCNSCFDNCLNLGGKPCAANCGEHVFIGDPFWVMGLCSDCFGDRYGNMRSGNGILRSVSGGPDRIRSRQNTADHSAPYQMFDDKSRALQPNRQGSQAAAAAADCWGFRASPDVQNRILFICVGISGWFTFNAMYAMQPMFVIAKGNAVLASISMSTQVGTVIAMMLHAMNRRREGEELGSSQRSNMSDDRIAFKKQRHERRSVARAKKVVHNCQLAACASMIGFASVWIMCSGNPPLWTLCFLGGVLGIVCNSSDLTVYRIALQYPSYCATDIQFGGCLSGMTVFANFVFISMGTFGVFAFFCLAASVQIFLWLVCLTRVADWPRLPTLPMSCEGILWRPSCACSGCEGCNFGRMRTPKVHLKGIEEALLDYESSEDEEGEGNLLGEKVAQLSIWCKKLTKSLCKTKDADMGSPSLVRFFTLGYLITQAISYSVPNIMPFMASAYRDHLAIYARMNRMYICGQMLGAVFFLVVPSYKPQKSHIRLSFVVFIATNLIIVVSAATPGHIARVIPEFVAAVIMPLIVFIMQVLARFIAAGIFKMCHEEASEGRVAKELSSTISFYGQLGCVGGNILVFLLVLSGLF
eukprot:TRINITY_DN104776_c0_g1_i1.p1 TRINITY_DN104776_c0_g1~~TRINITY_DN104776_c0_g1_i1.p1  ORF type:complete len:872 (+),score=90.60 TRINITY_DN104776_c0_g1_i1:40-2655(+)